MSHCETKIGPGIDFEQNLVWLCKGIKSVNKARKLFFLDIDFLNIALLQVCFFFVSQTFYSEYAILHLILF